MKKFSFLLFLFLAGKIFPQLDTIVQKNGQREAVRIVEMNFDEVKFRMPGDSLGGISTLKFNSIKMIITASGAKVMYDMSAQEHQEKKDKWKKLSAGSKKAAADFRRNLVGANLTQVIYSTIGISYQHIIESGVLGIKIPVSYNTDPYTMGTGYVNSYNINPLYRKFTTGLELSLFPFCQRRISYFIGPAFQVGIYNYMAADQNSPIWQKMLRTDGLHTSFIINNGFLFRIRSGFWADFSAGLGIQCNNSPLLGEDIRVRGSFQCNVGYSF